MYTAADVGFIAQNVYLFCASEGLATVVRASIDKPTLAKTLKLLPQQKNHLGAIGGVSEEVGFSGSNG